MKKPTLRSAALVAALAITATAWAATETLSTTVADDHTRPVWTDVESATSAPTEVPVATEDTLAPNETLVRPDDAVLTPRNAPLVQAEPIAMPAPQASVPEKPITVEERRMAVDERIKADLMDKLAAMPNISGKIGVETREAMVTLTGYVSTAGQAHRVDRAARSIDGVKGVDNQIRARIGGSVT